MQVFFLLFIELTNVLIVILEALVIVALNDEINMSEKTLLVTWN